MGLVCDRMASVGVEGLVNSNGAIHENLIGIQFWKNHF